MRAYWATGMFMLAASIGCSSSSTSKDRSGTPESNSNSTASGIIQKRPGSKDPRLPDATGMVQGKITYDGVPLGEGTITFVSEDNRSISAPIRPDGSYQLPDAAPGPHRIAVQLEPLTPPKDLSKFPGSKDPAKLQFAIPLRYASPVTSGLTYEVQKGRNIYDLDLNSR